MTNTSKKSVLIIGATGSLGLQLLRHIAKESYKIDEVHVMARNPNKLDKADRSLVNSIEKGNARDTHDIEQALRKTKANYVILATGNGHDVSKTDIREATGRALATVLQNDEFKDVQAIIMSSHGAAETKVIVGFGIGMLISFYLRHVFGDHTRQEAQFQTPSLEKRTLVVRPPSLTDDKALNDLKYVAEFDGLTKSPSISVDRSDIAAWVTREIATKPAISGRKVCLTNAKNIPKKK